MAKYLARIHGTEEDKVNCPFYFKIGACRHGDRCSRIHNRPAFSPTILIKHIYRHPVRVAELTALIEGGATSNEKTAPHDNKEQALEDFLQFFENFYSELGKYGQIEALHVCDNLCDHMIGHVYCKYYDEEDASDALTAMNGRFYDGQKMEVEFSPVIDFRDARCRDFDEGECSRGGFCNFMHIKPVPMCLIRSLEEDCEYDRRRRRREMEDIAREQQHQMRGERDDSSRRKRSHRDRDKSRGHDRSRERSRERERKRDRKHRRRESSDADDDGKDSHSVSMDKRGRSERDDSRRSRSHSQSRSRDRSFSPSPSQSSSHSKRNIDDTRRQEEKCDD